jgi:hypothetical protein
MPAALTRRPQKITFGEMRDSGVRGLLVYCCDYPCPQSQTHEECFATLARGQGLHSTSFIPTYRP